MYQAISYSINDAAFVNLLNIYSLNQEAADLKCLSIYSKVRHNKQECSDVGIKEVFAIVHIRNQNTT